MPKAYSGDLRVRRGIRTSRSVLWRFFSRHDMVDIHDHVWARSYPTEPQERDSYVSVYR
jgi:hypothetical protein